MGHPLPTAHELIFGRFAEGVAHSTMVAGEADAGTHGFRETVELFLGDLGHRIDRHHEAHFVQRRIGEGRCRVFGSNGEAVLLQDCLDDPSSLRRLMASPAPRYYQRLTHPALLPSPRLVQLAVNDGFWDHRGPLSSGFPSR